MFRVALSDRHVPQLLRAQARAHLRVRLDGDDLVAFVPRGEKDGEFARAGAELEDVCAGRGGDVQAGQEGGEDGGGVGGSVLVVCCGVVEAGGGLGGEDEGGGGGGGRHFGGWV